MDTKLLELLICPKSKGPLEIRNGKLYSKELSVIYPDLNGSPWLFISPDEVWMEWVNRFNMYLAHLDHSIVNLSKGLQEDDLFDFQKKRIQSLKSAYESQKDKIKKILPELVLDKNANVHLYQGTITELPLNQDFLGYYTNIHRDWCWGSKEIEDNLKMISDVSENKNLGTVLVLGSGAGRLVYELFKNYEINHLISVDINPLLHEIGKKVSLGEEIELYEFPLNPRDVESVAVLQTLKAEGGSLDSSKVSFIFCDGTQPPFRPEAFDTVITPWFIDIVPQGISTLANRINRILKPNGKWINIGTTYFRFGEVQDHFTGGELLNLIDYFGFKVESQKRKYLPYNQSPFSSQHRFEEILCFKAKKVDNIDPLTNEKTQPIWLKNHKKKIPLLDIFDNLTKKLTVQTKIIEQINGKASIDSISNELHRDFGISKEQMKYLIHNLLYKIWDSNRFSK